MGAKSAGQKLPGRDEALWNGLNKSCIMVMKNF
jgi:hypothetical protein